MMPLSQKDLRSKLVQIFNNLDPTQVRNLAFLAKGDYPITNESFKHGNKLLEELLHLSVVSRKKTAYLGKLLTIIGRKDLAKKLPRSFKVLTAVNKSRVFLYQVFTELDDENVQNLRFCYSIPRGEEIKDGIDLCLWLLKKQDLTRREALLSLAQSLKNIGRDALAESVKDYVQNNPETTNPHRHPADIYTSVGSSSTSSVQSSTLTDVCLNGKQPKGVKESLKNRPHIRDISKEKLSSSHKPSFLGKLSSRQHNLGTTRQSAHSGDKDGGQNQIMSQADYHRDRQIRYDDRSADISTADSRTTDSSGHEHESDEEDADGDDEYDDDDEDSDDENYYEQLKRNNDRLSHRLKTVRRRDRPPAQHSAVKETRRRVPSEERPPRRRVFHDDEQEADFAGGRPVLVYKQNVTEFDSNNNVLRRSESLVTLDVENCRVSQSMSDSGDDGVHRSDSRTTLNVSLVDLSIHRQKMDSGDEGGLVRTRSVSPVSRGRSTSSRRSRSNNAARRSQERDFRYDDVSDCARPARGLRSTSRSNKSSNQKDMEKCSTLCAIL